MTHPASLSAKTARLMLGGLPTYCVRAEVATSAVSFREQAFSATVEAVDLAAHTVT